LAILFKNQTESENAVSGFLHLPSARRLSVPGHPWPGPETP
jgi:hypothetical protein